MDINDPFDPKMKVMCRWGGTVCRNEGSYEATYIGGETKLIHLSRHATLVQLELMLQPLLDIHPSQFCIKYQLAGAGLDELVQISDQDDIKNFFEEADELQRKMSVGSGCAYMRIYLFSLREQGLDKFKSSPNTPIGQSPVTRSKSAFVSHFGPGAIFEERPDALDPAIYGDTADGGSPFVGGVHFPELDSVTGTPTGDQDSPFSKPRLRSKSLKNPPSQMISAPINMSLNIKLGKDGISQLAAMLPPGGASGHLTSPGPSPLGPSRASPSHPQFLQRVLTMPAERSTPAGPRQLMVRELVWLGKWRGAPVAIKEMHSSNFEEQVAAALSDAARLQGEQGEQQLADFYREQCVLASMAHPNVVGFYGVVEGEKGLSTVTEYVKGGSLKSCLSKLKKRCVDNAARRIGCQARSASGEPMAWGVCEDLQAQSLDEGVADVVPENELEIEPSGTSMSDTESKNNSPKNAGSSSEGLSTRPDEDDAHSRLQRVPTVQVQKVRELGRGTYATVSIFLMARLSFEQGACGDVRRLEREAFEDEESGPAPESSGGTEAGPTPDDGIVVERQSSGQKRVQAAHDVLYEIEADLARLPELAASETPPEDTLHPAHARTSPRGTPEGDTHTEAVETEMEGEEAPRRQLAQSLAEGVADVVPGDGWSLSFGNATRVKLAADAARGLEYLHWRRVIHFDVKGDNILADVRDLRNPVGKVGDLGLAKLKHSTFVSGNMRGTLPWMAPELFPTLPGSAGDPLKSSSCYQADRVTEKIDVYSFGVLLWEIWTWGEVPYKGMEMTAIFFGMMHNSLRPAKPVTPAPAEGWQELMEACWVAEPAKRPSFSSIVDALDVMLQEGQVQEQQPDSKAGTSQ
eukprot:gene2359-3089_t